MQTWCDLFWFVWCGKDHPTFMVENQTVVSVPEPGTVLFLLFGIALLALVRGARL